MSRNHRASSPEESGWVREHLWPRHDASYSQLYKFNQAVALNYLIGIQHACFINSLFIVMIIFINNS